MSDITRWDGKSVITDNKGQVAMQIAGKTAGDSSAVKISFFSGVTPVVRPSSTTDLKDAVVNLGLYTDGGATPLNLDGGALSSGDHTIANGKDLLISATTGSKVGQSGSKVGFFGVTPVVRSSALTQTYSTATSVHSNATATANATTASTKTTPWGFATSTQANAVAAASKATVADLANLKQFVNKVVDQLQSLGLLQ